MVWVPPLGGCLQSMWTSGPECLCTAGCPGLLPAQPQPPAPPLCGALPAHPQLLQLAAALPAVLAGSVAPATYQRYLGPWRKFLLWCREVGLPLPDSGVPAPPMHVALHMVLLLQSAQSYSVVKAFSAAVSFFHRTVGSPSPCDSQMVQAVRGAAHRALPSGEGRKAPLQYSHLQRIVTHCARPCAPLSDLWMGVWAVFGFFGFFRYSDLARIQVEWCFVTDAGVRIFLESRKNDQFREGSWIFMAANPGDLVCPVGLARRWLSEAGLQPAGEQAMFPLVVGGVVCGPGPAPYSGVRDQFRATLSLLGIPPDAFGTHSLRSGGATLAANCGVQDRLWREHGGWRSERCALGYVQTAASAKLAVTAAMLSAVHSGAADEADTACCCCGSTEWWDGNEMLLCEGAGCNAGWHLLCLTPPLSSVPEGTWLCPVCQPV